MVVGYLGSIITFRSSPMDREGGRKAYWMGHICLQRKQSLIGSSSSCYGNHIQALWSRRIVYVGSMGARNGSRYQWMGTGERMEQDLRRRRLDRTMDRVMSRAGRQETLEAGQTQ